MTEISKQLYQKIDALFNGLEHIEPFTKVDLGNKGFPDVNIVVFESTPDNIHFVLSRYEKENGRPIANPYFEIAADPKQQTANVVTYKNAHYFHAQLAVPDKAGTNIQCEGNLFLYGLLNSLQDRLSSQMSFI
jgi:hypothetical protein